MRIAKIKWAMPHCYALIFFIIILVALLTWCIPSGSFDYHSVTLPGGETKTLVIPGSYHLLDKVSSEGDLRQGIAAVLAAPMEGIIKAADVVAFVLIVGGAFGIILRTGAIERGLVALAERLAGKGILVIPIAMTLFSLGGATFGMSEEVIPLYAIFISLMFALGYDSMTAILILSGNPDWLRWRNDQSVLCTHCPGRSGYSGKSAALATCYCMAGLHATGDCLHHVVRAPC